MSFHIQSALAPSAAIDKLRSVTYETDGGPQALLQNRGAPFTGAVTADWFRIHRSTDESYSPMAVAIGNVSGVGSGSGIDIGITMSAYAIFFCGLISALLGLMGLLLFSGTLTVSLSPSSFFLLIGVPFLLMLLVVGLFFHEASKIKLTLTTLWQTEWPAVA
jgi:hypothetical protein